MKKLAVLGIILGVVVLLVLILLYGFFKSEFYIKGQIDKANYCNVKEDCVDAGSKCPFGCYNYVNKNEVGRISKMIDSYSGTKCVYSCLYCPGVECRNNKCIPVCQ